MESLNKGFREVATRARGPRLLSLLVLSMTVVSTRGQQLPEPIEIPAAATALEGVPTSLGSSDENGTEKRVLNVREATKNRLLVTIVNGTFYWASRGNRQLKIHQSGAFTYLYEGPGAYIKFARVGNKIVYLEHGNIFLSTVTYWGEIKIITGK
jgi:hypothetical protein